MRKIPFWKVESVGNDFVLVHLDDVDRLITSDLEDASRLTTGGYGSRDEFLNKLAIKASNRHFGIGSDGLLALGIKEDGTILLRMFNPDGSEDFCGNGIRCAFDHAVRMGWMHPGLMRMSHHGLSVTGRAVNGRIEFELPPASYAPKDIPLVRDEEAFDTELLTVDGKAYRGSVLSTGTAHTIIPVATLPADEEFFRVSPQIENSPLFPERTSVMWTREDAPFKIALRIWERGAGETRGCGTGSTAAALDYLRRKASGGRVQVDNSGGTLVVSATSFSSSPHVSGEAFEVFTGELWL